jgi:4-amino-4-deoxy-L-arabinose transferase-like glycosyltransferase
MKKFLSRSFIKQNIFLIIVTLVSLILRLHNLGYSDFQGDEIKALYLPEEDQNFFSYIMDQRKGPVQFIITFLLKFLDPGYNNQFFLRLPFALAGFFSVVFFFKLVKKHFGEKVAFYSSMFFATNGFFIAFSRIIQYQSFVILFMVLALYFLTLATKDKKYKVSGIYLGLLFWALSILTHYDGVFIAPFVTYLLIQWFEREGITKKQKITTFLVSGVTSLLLLLSFYIPFVMTLSDSTKDYWAGRITGEVSAKISSSKYLFTVYQPIYVVHIYIILFILGAIFISLGLFSKYILKIKKLPELVKDFFKHTTDLMKNVQENWQKIICLVLWIAFPMFFFEKIFYISGTHIYNYLVPVFIVLAYGIITLESVTFKIFEYQIVKVLNFLGVLVLFIFLFAQSYAVFVDNYREYPWEEEDFFVWRFPKPNPTFHLSMFGFPYNRDWEGVREFTKKYPEAGAYSTNERRSIARYYVNLPKNTEVAGFYVYVKNPQSYFEDTNNEKFLYWSGKYQPEYTYTRYGRDMVRVYVMEPGSLEEIIEKGF